MTTVHTQKDINTISDTERNQLLDWIPLLIKEKLNTLTTEQLRILHYILGYNCQEETIELLMEEFEGYGYDENIACEFINILKRDNYLIMQKPY